MTSFILEVLKNLISKGYTLSDLTFILPNKRSGTFLKQQIHKVCNKTIFAPEILSIEEFVEELSQLKSVSNIDLTFEFFNAYKDSVKKENQDSFESFSKWAPILLQDFNEIDRHLIKQDHIFNYLSAIQEINHWSLEINQTQFITNYLSFWNSLGKQYENFTTSLINKKIGPSPRGR